MSQKISLKAAERKAFRTTYNDGLVDIFLGCFFLMFVIAPYLSASLGDFWSSAVFLPFWALVYLAIWLIIVVSSGMVYPWWVWVAGPWGALLLIRTILGGRRDY